MNLSLSKYLFGLLLALVSLSAFADKSIPLEVFAQPAKYKTIQISPSGKYLAFTYEEGTEVKLGIIDRKTFKPTASFEFGDNRHVVGFDWLNDERLSMTVQTRIGWLDGTNPRTYWAAANADGSNRRVLWDDRNFGSLTMIDTLKNEPDYVLAVKRNWRDGGKVKLFKVNTETNKQSYLADSPKAAAFTDPGVIGFGTDAEGNVRFALEYDQGDDENIPDDDQIFLHYKNLNSDEWRKLNVPSVRSDRPFYNFLGTNKKGDIAYFISNFDMKDNDTHGLFEFDMTEKTIKLVYRHPDVDVRSGLYGKEGELIGVYLEPGYPEYQYVENDENMAEIKLHKGLSASFPGQFMRITSRTEDNMKLLLAVRSDRNPGDFYLFDRKDMKISYISSAKPEVKPKQMARVEPFILKARDGLQMYGFLTIPNGKEQKNLPMVVYPHGGPYGVSDDWRWDRRAQMLASRGYLVLQLNYRGSGNYGEAFERAGYTEWGAKMQDDLTDATKWAINQGIADPERICIHGVSYGGYASMNAVVKEPDLYKCSIPDAGVYEMRVQWDEADSFKGRGGSDRKEWYMKRTIGGYDKVEERSPVYHVNKLKADLFLVHGGEDVRVPIINAEILEEKLKEAKKPYITLYKDEEGHGFSKPANRIELYGAILDFLKKHIGD